MGRTGQLGKNMKTTLYLYIPILVVSTVLVSCNKKAPEPNIQAPEPTPIVTPIPAPIPTATPEPTPQVRLAPSGTLYVVKHFSVSMEDGLHGFPIGRKVTITSEDDLNFTVTDGTMTGTAPKASFTNNLDVVDKLSVKQAAIAESQQVAIQAVAIQKKAADEAATTNEKIKTVEKQAQYKSNLLAQLPALRARENELWSILGPRYVDRGSNKSGWTSADDNARLEELGRVKGQIKQVESELKRVSAPTPPVLPPDVASKLNKLNQQCNTLKQQREAIRKQRDDSIKGGNSPSSVENKDRMKQIETLNPPINELDRQIKLIQQNKIY